jgi:hypothetical protein
VDDVDVGALPPLIDAAIRGRLAAARALLAAGADPDVVDQLAFGEDGATALEWACGKGYGAVARLLLDAGADASRGAPLRSAVRRGDLDLVQRLVSAGARRSGVLHEAASDELLHILTWLVEAGVVDVDAVEDDWTPLMVAAEVGQVEAVRELLRLGVDPDRRTEEGRSAEDIAAERGEAAVVSALRGEPAADQRRVWMKWSSRRYMWDGLASEDSLRHAYAEHLRELKPDLPPDLLALSEAGGMLTLHDGRVLKVAGVGQDRLSLVFEARDWERSGTEPPVVVGRISYEQADMVAPEGPGGYQGVYVSRDADILDCELDRAPDGRLEHRIQFERDFPTLVIRFVGASLEIVRFDEAARTVDASEFIRDDPAQ